MEKRDTFRSACTEKANDTGTVDNERMGGIAEAGTSVAFAGEDMHVEGGK